MMFQHRSRAAHSRMQKHAVGEVAWVNYGYESDGTCWPLPAPIRNGTPRRPWPTRAKLSKAFLDSRVWRVRDQGTLTTHHVSPVRRSLISTHWLGFGWPKFSFPIAESLPSLSLRGPRQRPAPFFRRIACSRMQTHCETSAANHHRINRPDDQTDHDHNCAQVSFSAHASVSRRRRYHASITNEGMSKPRHR